MNTDMIWQISTESSEDTIGLGKLIGQNLVGNECIELVSDLGGGKTTLVKGIAMGMGCDENVSSPTFVLSRQYKCSDDRIINHYDMYRLADPGIVAMQVQESLDDNSAVTIIEWAESLKNILPENKLVINIKASPDNENKRSIDIHYSDESSGMIEKIRNQLQESKA